MTVYEIVTDRIIKALEAGNAPWRKPWGSMTGGIKAQNLQTKTQYKGINAILTNMAGFNSPYWLTYKGATAMGGQVRRGEKGTPIVYWGKVEKTNASGEDASFMLIRYYTAFNLDQIDGIEAPKVDKIDRQFKPIESAELISQDFFNRTKVGLTHGGDRAYYSPSQDRIQMPNREAFKSSEGYYGTLFHEMTHATGHESRLNRLDKIAHFGSHEYSKEELIAEMGASFLLGEAGIHNDDMVENSAAYLKSWIDVLKGDSRLVITAASQAQKASDLILNKNNA